MGRRMLSAPVNIQSGESASLVTPLTVSSQNSADYELSSEMDLTNFFEKRVSEYQKVGVLTKEKDSDGERISFDADL